MGGGDAGRRVTWAGDMASAMRRTRPRLPCPSTPAATLGHGAVTAQSHPCSDGPGAGRCATPAAAPRPGTRRDAGLAATGCRVPDRCGCLPGAAWLNTRSQARPGPAAHVRGGWATREATARSGATKADTDDKDDTGDKGTSKGGKQGRQGQQGGISTLAATASMCETASTCVTCRVRISTVGATLCRREGQALARLSSTCALPQLSSTCTLVHREDQHSGRVYTLQRLAHVHPVAPRGPARRRRSAPPPAPAAPPPPTAPAARRQPHPPAGRRAGQWAGRRAGRYRARESWGGARDVAVRWLAPRFRCLDERVSSAPGPGRGPLPCRHAASRRPHPSSRDAWIAAAVSHSPPGHGPRSGPPARPRRLRLSLGLIRHSRARPRRAARGADVTGGPGGGPGRWAGDR